MNMFAPKVTVQPPARQPLPFGLFSVFQPQTSAERWVAGGTVWEALTCENVVGFPLGVTEQTGADTHDFSAGIAVGGEARPFTIMGYFEDTLMTSDDAYATSKAEEHLLLHEQRRVEQALWTGDLKNYPNLAGAHDPGAYPAPEDLGTANLVDSIALLEHYIATELGFQGVLHIPRHLASRLASENVLEARGGRLVTRLDTPVVAGAGYDGDRMVVTPSIFGYRSAVETWVTVDAGKNNRTATAARDYVIGYDPCGTAAVTVSFASAPPAGGASSEVTIVGSSVPLPVEVQNDTINVSGSVEVSNTVTTNVSNTERSITGVADVNVTNAELNVRTVTDETP